ncbi:hypothetical protein VP01_195g5 [Puccinia sorghi]|uniref:Uncharacterized protein n=1 Tax=Puccinia sorghi TaxID=27349 RepID=A0A0L6VC46_9BASI|nr:hypothetical protein VP01_195g5 [Puccinia sorghi]
MQFTHTAAGSVGLSFDYKECLKIVPNKQADVVKILDQMSSWELKDDIISQLKYNFPKFEHHL